MASDADWAKNPYSNSKLIWIVLTYCLIASSSYNRLGHIRQMRWEFGSVLPPDIKYNLSEQEVSANCIYNLDFTTHIEAAVDAHACGWSGFLL